MVEWLLARRHTPLQIFVCDEESHFYSQVLEKLLLRNCRDSRTRIIEFGAGDGTPVINALLRGASAGCNFGDSVVHGYELNPRAAAVASRKAAQMGVAHQYKASGWVACAPVLSLPATLQACRWPCRACVVDRSTAKAELCHSAACLRCTCSTLPPG